MATAFVAAVSDFYSYLYCWLLLILVLLLLGVNVDQRHCTAVCVVAVYSGGATS